MEKMSGIISQEPISTGDYSSPMDSVLDVLPTTNLPTQTKEVVEDSVAPKAKETAQGDDSSTGYLLANALKENGLDLGDLDKKISTGDFVKKLNSYIEQNTEEKAKNIFGKDVIEGAKLINNGLSLEKTNQLAELNLLSKQKLDITDDMDDKDRDTMLSNAKVVIEEYYKDKLSGKALEKALSSIDEYSDDFKQEFDEASAHHNNKRAEFIKNETQKIDNKNLKERDFEKSIRKEIESGEVFGTKMTPAEIKQAITNTYEPTETITIDGTDYKVSKYEKTVHELANNPKLAAKLMLSIAEGLTLETAKNQGKEEYANELDKRFRNSMDFPTGGNRPVLIGGKQQIKGIIKEVESKSY